MKKVKHLCHHLKKYISQKVINRHKIFYKERYFHSLNLVQIKSEKKNYNYFHIL